MMEPQVEGPDDMLSTESIDVILQMSTQHRVYRAMVLMSKPSGLVSEAMLPEEVSFRKCAYGYSWTL